MKQGASVQQISRVAIDEFVGRLRAIPAGEFTRAMVLGRMSSLLLDRESMEPYRHFVPGHYTRNKIFRDDLFEVLLLCWGVGDRTPVHNHDNQLGWMSVQQGMLSLQNFRRVGCAMGGPGPHWIWRGPMPRSYGRLLPRTLSRWPRSSAPRSKLT